MADLLTYTLKVGICLAVFYLFFKLLLSRETYHRLNRILILSAVVLSFLLPVCVITVKHEILVSGIPSSISELTGVFSETNEQVVWLTILGFLYILGIIVSLCTMSWSLLRLQKVFRQGERKELEGGMHLILMDEKTAPFSWGKYIVMSHEDWELAGSTVLLHEQAHVRLHHTWDLMLTDILGAAQWFNPAMILLRHELRRLHEYEADAEVLRSGVTPKDYQLLLIRKAVGGRWYSVANSFNHNNLKKRINMMLQKKSSGKARAKSLLVLPLLCTAVLAFAETKYVPVEGKDSETSQDVVKSYRDIMPILLNDKTLELWDDTTAVMLDSLSNITVKTEMSCSIRDDEDKDDAVSVSLKGENVLFILDGRIVKSIDDIDADKIESITAVKDKDAIEKYGIVAEGRFLVLEVKLKRDDTQLPQKKRSEKVTNKGVTVKQFDYGNSLYVVDGKIVDSFDDIDPDDIESVTVVKYQKRIEEYGKAAEGKDGVVEVSLKHDNSKEDESGLMGKIHKVVGSNVLILVNGRHVNSLDGIDSEKIKSITVIQEKKQMKKYGKDAKGKDGVIEVELKSEE